MSDAVMLVGAVIGIFLFIAYHKVFHVMYFGKLGPAIFGELLGSWLLGCLIAGGLVKLGASLLEIVLTVAIYAFMILMSIYCVCLIVYKRKRKKAEDRNADNEAVQAGSSDVPEKSGFMERSIKWRKENRGVSFLLFFFYFGFTLLFIVLRFE